MCNDWDYIKTITEAEHHFNNVCFKIRTVASTWTLATFAGIGFLLEKSIRNGIEVNNLIVLLCWAGAVGIFVLWILDLLIYQKLLNAWFDERKEIEKRNKDFPQIWENVKKTQPGGRASNLIKIYYIGLCFAPLFFATFICYNYGKSHSLYFMSVILLITIPLLIY